MNRKIACLFGICLLIFYQNSSAQLLRDTLPMRKWSVSLNPLGPFEPQAAWGVGIGYRLNKRYEIWSETSLLTIGPLSAYAHISGLRQIVQIKYFFDPKGPFFWAAEVRYKGFSLSDTSMFYQPVTHDTIARLPYRSRHYFIGGAWQFGCRFRLSKKGNLLLEMTAGLGIKQKSRYSDGAPAGYQYVPPLNPIEPNVNYIMQHPGTTIYLPGSVRFVYVFGKKLL